MHTEQLKDILHLHELPRSPSVRIFRPASVLMPLFEKDNGVHLLAVLKADTEGYPWRNQVALPGGHVDGSDDSTMMTAYREIKEELNIDASQIEMIGSLGYFQTIRQTEIEAFVGIWDGDRSGLRFDAQEISATLEISLGDLIKTHVANNYQGRRPDVSHLIYPAGGFPDSNIVIWGVTAIILHFFLEHLRMHAPEMFGDLVGKRLFR
jgi:peroxisomal coenzyme A diphosphatase NUDT7